MPTGWNYQVRAGLRPGLDERLLADLEGLVGNARPGGGNALALPRSRHALPTHLPYAFAHPLADDTYLAGPGFGPGLLYDGSRFEGLAGASIENGVLTLGIRAEGLEREIDEEEDAFGSGASRLSALFDFLTRVTDGPVGEVLGRINSDHHTYGHPLIRCADGRVRLVHTMGIPRGRERPLPLPRVIPAFVVETRDSALADLDEDALRDWLRRGRGIGSDWG